ncbi:hypothetical protein MMP66_03240 [Acinetobacter dispersus]|uniref:hypothetical protein n=1 Tax=Acinetobacter dispersus TaxID=70348 RepID=UPI001F4AE9CB|nr:hypothetical protein [Acinetobacter dispersus]MCH7393291.1 hypothetical protein [Acinetobacter dispersus]
MVKRYMLKEVDARSDTGDKIIVEQIYEKEPATDLEISNLSWLPLSKVVIRDTVIQLNDDLTFIHPRTGKIFKIGT